MLPLLGYSMRGQGVRGSVCVAASTVIWLLFTVAVFVQALQGQPFLVLN